MDYFGYKNLSCIKYPLFSKRPSLPSTPIVLPSLSLPTPSQKPKRRVLLVDDNSVNLRILSRLLCTTMSNVFDQIESVKSGVKALDVLQNRTFDLILMDIDMPILNGVETTRHIRAAVDYDILEHNRSIPIVAVTTNDSEEWCQLYTKVGMNGCISKPIVPKDLKSTLSKLLDISFFSTFTP
ncbi:unnamed protein product [Rhizopus stolonifer]